MSIIRECSTMMTRPGKRVHVAWILRVLATLPMIFSVRNVRLPDADWSPKDSQQTAKTQPADSQEQEGNQ